MERTEKPLLIYDGDCGFCAVWVDHWMQQAGGRVLSAPSQQVGNRYPEITEQEFMRAVWLVYPNGRRTNAGEAVLELLAFSPRKTWLLWLYRHLPGFAAITEFFYSFIASHRKLFSRITKLVRYPDRSETRFVRLCHHMAAGGFLMAALVKITGPQVERIFFTDGGLPIWEMFLLGYAEAVIGLLLIPRVTATFAAILGMFVMVGAFATIIASGWYVLFILNFGMAIQLVVVGWAKRDGLSAWLDDDESCSLPPRE